MALQPDGNATPPTVIAGTPQTLTAGWVNLGGEMELYRKKEVGLWLEIDINLSNNLRVRFLALSKSGDALKYSVPIETVSATIVNLDNEEKEFSADADQVMLVNWTLPGYVPYGQFQVMVGTLGATAAIITSAKWAAAS